MMRKIAIVPGHGGSDPGGTGGGMKESKINLNVGLKLQELLKSDGYEAVISRTSDTQYLAPSQQLAWADKQSADLVIAIHENDAANETAKGSEVFYQPTSERSKKLANLIDLEFRKLGQESRGVKTFDRSIAIMKAKAPTVLTEFAFLTAADVKDTDTLAEQWAQAQAIRNAIMRLDGRM